MSVSVEIQDHLGAVDLDVSLTLERGVGVLFGPSGAGKTSVIRAVSGLWAPRDATITLDGEVLHDTRAGIFRPAQSRKIGYIFQEPRLFPHLNVRQNLNFGRTRQRQSAMTIAFDDVIDVLGIASLLERGPGHLSGGEQQRVAIARAVLSGPRLLLADEPLAALDAPRRAEILAMFETIVTEFDIPMLYVTHSAAEAARLAHRVYLLKEGRVSAQGAAQDVLMQMGPSGPDQELGSFVSAQVELCDPDGLTQLDAGGAKLYIAKPYSVGARVLLRIAAHDVMIATQTVAGVSALNIIEGVVAEIHETDRAHATVGIQTAAGLIWSRVTQRSVARLGLRLGLDCHAVIKSVAVAQDNL